MESSNDLSIALVSNPMTRAQGWNHRIEASPRLEVTETYSFSHTQSTDISSECDALVVDAAIDGKKCRKFVREVNRNRPNLPIIVGTPGPATSADQTGRRQPGELVLISGEQQTKIRRALDGYFQD